MGGCTRKPQSLWPWGHTPCSLAFAFGPWGLCLFAFAQRFSIVSYFLSFVFQVDAWNVGMDIVGSDATGVWNGRQLRGHGQRASLRRVWHWLFNPAAGDSATDCAFCVQELQ